MKKAISIQAKAALRLNMKAPISGSNCNKIQPEVEMQQLESGKRREEIMRVLSTGDLPGVYLQLDGIADAKEKKCIITAFDITERKKEEEVLRKAAGSFRAIFENNSEAIAIVEKDSTISMVNDAYCEMSGYSKQDVIGKSWKQHVHPDDIRFMKQYYRSRLTTESEIPVKYEFRFLKKNGEIRHGLITVAMYKSGEKIIASFTDISDRKQAESVLRESEQYFRSLADSGQALIWTSGTDKQCNYFNQPWLNFTGRTLEQELGNGWAKGVHPDDLQSCFNTYVGAFDHREKFSMEYRVRSASGEYRWIMDDGTPRYDVNNEFAGYIGHCLDITDRRIAEEKLMKSHEQLVLAQQSAGAGFWDWDMTNDKFEWSPELYRLFDLDPSVDNANFDVWFRIIHRDDKERVGENLYAAIQNHLRLENENRIILASGEERWISTLGDTSYDEDNTPIRMTGICFDITSRKQSEKVLKEKVEELEKFNQYMTGRENRMIELKQEVNELCSVLNQADRYSAPKKVKENMPTL